MVEVLLGARSPKKSKDGGVLREFYDQHLRSFLNIEKNKTPENVVHREGLLALDMKIVAQVHDLLLKYRDPAVRDEDKRDIFIFAGAKHISTIIPVLEQELRCIECPVYENNNCSLSNRRAIAILRDYIPLMGITAHPDHQALARQWMDKYKVDIAEFFKIEQ